MAICPPAFPHMPDIAGVRLASCASGIKKNGASDLLLMTFCSGTQVAAAFTTNRFQAAPVLIAKAHRNQCTKTRALIINSGNANVGLGEIGLTVATESCRLISEKLGIAPETVLPFSTGVIAEPMPLEPFAAHVDDLVRAQAADGWLQGAQAIMTTDTFAKGATTEITIDGKPVRINGIAKGSGMICPNMATMLAFIACDADVKEAVLSDILHTALDASFHRISVDGDMSTNDACVLAATGQSGVRIRDKKALSALTEGIVRVCAQLAESIVRDGEGATKLITIAVDNGASPTQCKRIACAVANSLLCKTAFFASDPNWGRVLAAVGAAAVHDDTITLDTIRLALDNECVFAHGARVADYDEARARAVLLQDEFTVRITLGCGDASAVLLTNDLSYEYVRINAEYRS